MARTATERLLDGRLDKVTTTAVQRMIRIGEKKLKADPPIEPNNQAVAILMYEIRQETKNLNIARAFYHTVLQRTLGFYPDLDIAKPKWENGILEWDEIFARDLEGFGEDGLAAAKTFREGAKKRAEQYQQNNDVANLWKMWIYDETISCAPWMAMFGIVLWLAYIREEYENEQLNTIAAITIPVIEKALEAHQKDVHIVVPDDGHPTLVNSSNATIATLERLHSPLLPPVPKIETDVAIALLQQSAPALKSLDAQRVLRWEIFEGHKRVKDHVYDPRLITITNGWGEIAHEAGCGDDHESAARVRNIIQAQAWVCIRLPGKQERLASLIAYDETSATTHRPAQIKIVLGTILLPQHLYDYHLEDFEQRAEFYAARKLVPMCSLPPFVGRKQDWEPQASLSSWIVVEMRKQALAITNTGSALLTQKTLEELAERASLPVKLLPEVLDRWLNDGSDGPAFLDRVEKDRYILAKNHADRWDFIVAAGKSERAAKYAGKRRALAKWRRDRKKGSK